MGELLVCSYELVICVHLPFDNLTTVDYRVILTLISMKLV
jgi:hypothetical protein